MKISETKVGTKQFEPVTLNITFESKEELEYFYGMTNSSVVHSDHWNNNNLGTFSMTLFNWVDNKLEELV